MKTTLSKLSVCVTLLLVVSCARKASIYSDIFSSKFISESFRNDVIEEKNIVNKPIIEINNNYDFFVGNRSSSYPNSNGVSASAFASVTIIDPASISQSEELVFEKISLNKLKNKFVSLKEIGASYQRILVPNLYSNTAQNIGEFNIEGGFGRALDISVPKQITLYHQNGNDVLSVLINTKNCSKKSDITNNFKFTLDGKVYYNTLSNPGTYSSKDFAVTVNYN